MPVWNVFTKQRRSLLHNGQIFGTKPSELKSIENYKGKSSDLWIVDDGDNRRRTPHDGTTARWANHSQWGSFRHLRVAYWTRTYCSLCTQLVCQTTIVQWVTWATIFIATQVWPTNWAHKLCPGPKGCAQVVKRTPLKWLGTEIRFLRLHYTMSSSLISIIRIHCTMTGFFCSH